MPSTRETRYEYKVRPVGLQLGAGAELSENLASELERVIAQETAGGWEYYRSESVSGYDDAGTGGPVEHAVMVAVFRRML